MSEGYYVGLRSYQDSVEVGKSFIIEVYSVGKVQRSSAIPMEMLEEVMEEVEIVRVGGMGISIWCHEISKLVVFAPGSVERVDIIFNKGG
jgi:hypothetical protein